MVQMNPTDDVRIQSLRPLIPAAILLEEIPLAEGDASFVSRTRQDIARALRGEDGRLVVICGPCSIHDVQAARDYARLLKVAGDRLSSDIIPVMRVYFEKPRTTIGWKGLINDPDLDNSFAINRGLRMARQLLVDLVHMGVACGTEFLDVITPQYMADVISWGAIGARTTESQVHRELASGLSAPVGFKNGTGGSIDIAVDAVRAASCPHSFLSVTKQGLAAIVQTRGNDAAHIILRGGKRTGPNYGAEAVADAVAQLEAHRMPGRVMVDCSHGNSEKDHRRQSHVAQVIAEQIINGSDRVFGVMLESHLVGGRQDMAPRDALTYGQSITDACLGWEDTVPVLEMLAAAVRERRARRG
jgi:3-deoxy-7-phosphoheptulonate synthase